MSDDELILERLEMLSKRDDKLEKETERLKELAKLPFWKRIQAKENESQIKRVHETQKSTFERICRRDKIHKEDWKDEFCLFWDGFLKGEFKSINQYLKRKNHAK